MFFITRKLFKIIKVKTKLKLVRNYLLKTMKSVIILTSMENIVSEESSPLLITEKISLFTKLSYSLGHVFNDLAAAMWFSYTLLYLQRITKLEPLTAGALLLLGK